MLVVFVFYVVFLVSVLELFVSFHAIYAYSFSLSYAVYYLSGAVENFVVDLTVIVNCDERVTRRFRVFLKS